jgi:hypothetical protein
MTALYTLFVCLNVYVESPGIAIIWNGHVVTASLRGQDKDSFAALGT